MSLLERYEIERGGTVYTVDLMHEDTPHPTRKNYYAYVSDPSERVVRTRNVGSDAMARRAAGNTITNWFIRRTVRDPKPTGKRANIPTEAILTTLRADPGCGLVDVAAAIGKKTGTMSKWLERMSYAGLVRHEMTTYGTRPKRMWFACEGAAP